MKHAPIPDPAEERALVQSAPCFDPEQAALFAAHQYGVSGVLLPLPSERDQNFQIDTASGERFVFKIANAAESAALLDAQNHALHRIAAAGLPGSTVVRTLYGEPIGQVVDSTGGSYYVRLLSFVPGSPLARVRPHRPELLDNLGRFLAAVDRALAGYDHPALHRVFHWDLTHAAEVVRSQVEEIADLARRQQVRSLLERFEQTTAPLLADLPHQVIHGDANDYNVLVSSHGALFDQFCTVAGILDLGDMVYSVRVADLAIAAAYVLLEKPDPLAAVAQVTAGYCAVYPLEEAELAVLWDLVCMRLCVSVCQAAHQRALQPANAYLSISEQPAWAALQKLASIHPRLAHYTLRSACGLPAVPHAQEVTRWLGEQPVAPLLGEALHPLHIFDLSVGSPLLPAALLRSPARLAAALAAELAEQGACVGVGRYAECRLAGLFADSPTADSPTADSPTAERRTRSLALELWVAAGTAVRAPLEGVVQALGRTAAGVRVILRHPLGTGSCLYTLYSGLGEGCLAQLTPGCPLAAGSVFAEASPRSPGGLACVQVQLVTDLLDLGLSFPANAAPSQAALWGSLTLDPAPLAGISAERFPAPAPTSAQTLAERRTRIGRNLSISYRQPIKVVRGLGQYLYDAEGRAYLDAVNNVAHVGHCHPAVVAAGQRQMAVLNTNTRYLHDAINDYARRLAATLPSSLSVFFFVNSGSEANDLALRLARTATGRQAILAVDVAYHGHTQSLIEVSPYKHDGPGGAGRPPYVQKVILPDPYRGPHTGYSAATGTRYAAYVQQALQQGDAVAAFICESLMGCGGQIVFPENYLAAAFQHVRAVGGLCIADEVQTGFGRVGSHFWGFQSQGVVPDIVTMGKPAGNGHPLAIVATTPEIADRFANGMEYFNTFGGNPVSCAIGLAVLDVIEQEQLQQNARILGDVLLAGLRRLQADFPLIGDVRGLGLYIGVELVLDPETLEPAGEHAAYVANRLREAGILISTDGPCHNVLKIKPPIVFGQSDADHLLNTLAEILSENALAVRPH
jgi:4-aminobutyrate aminotransferase-like enzyme/Ser/Thr protein kinase RdoA (MazF antagonist)